MSNVDIIDDIAEINKLKDNYSIDELSLPIKMSDGGITVAEYLDDLISRGLDKETIEKSVRDAILEGRKNHEKADELLKKVANMPSEKISKNMLELYIGSVSPSYDSQNIFFILAVTLVDKILEGIRDSKYIDSLEEHLNNLSFRNSELKDKLYDKLNKSRVNLYYLSLMKELDDEENNLKYFKENVTFLVKRYSNNEYTDSYSLNDIYKDLLACRDKIRYKIRLNETISEEDKLYLETLDKYILEIDAKLSVSILNDNINKRINYLNETVKNRDEISYFNELANVRKFAHLLKEMDELISDKSLPGLDDTVNNVDEMINSINKTDSKFTNLM